MGKYGRSIHTHIFENDSKKGLKHGYHLLSIKTPLPRNPGTSIILNRFPHLSGNEKLSLGLKEY